MPPFYDDSLLFLREYRVNSIYQKAAETRKLSAQDEKNKRLREPLPLILKNILSLVRSEAQLCYCLTSGIPHFMQ